ncbi:hypothetical protein ENUP19_0102G0029 [Entamoeba nuttalli]|uniref:Uncharacterized protein n=2 Tax=Entamoeba nuttalli TaxID=412467 RepID=K2GCF9_ENTNP|nr:hypothetical protein ENU1_097990 [Entamoeba nuttalli P19]EKE40216.1 hypothetical protein ENU1_097990 [Entamoeba nuttalli P19]|eukprot:XP_008857447.1 hypothetical protein ENU1_097990 [Entamoeba nuttalli P19]
MNWERIVQIPEKYKKRYQKSYILIIVTGISLITFTTFIIISFPLINLNKLKHKEYLYLSSEQIETHKVNNFNVQKNNWKDNVIDVATFNYEGKCKNFFQFKPNNKRDLLVYSFGFFTKGIYMKQRTAALKTLSITRQAIPHAKIVALLLWPSPTPLLYDDMKKYNVEVVDMSDIPFGHFVVTRYIAFTRYIKRHQSDYDRVIFSDTRDVVIFNDIFATFGVNDLIWTTECPFATNSTSNELSLDFCCSPANNHNHFQWLESFFGDEITRNSVINKQISLNGGFGMGGMKKMIIAMNSFVKRMRWFPSFFFGYDQALMNVLYYSKEFGVEMKLEGCTQRSCFYGKHLLKLKNKSVIYSDTGCSPIVVHKLTLTNSDYHMT